MNRIASLPRRDWTEQAEELVGPMTRELRTPNGSMTLRPIQAITCYEARPRKGSVFMSGRVGCGKTISSGVLPGLIKAKRPVLLVPADGNMVEKTEREFSELRMHWQIPNNIRIMTYQFLGQPQNSEALLEYNPDWLGCDEAQCLKHVKKASCAKRVAKFLAARQPGFAAFSGSFTGSGNILDYCHHLVWALGDGAPVPLRPAEQARWARVLNPRVEARHVDWREVRAALGEGVRSWSAAQEAFAERLRLTPGVIVSQDQFDWPLEIVCHADSPPAETKEAFAELRKRWVAPDDFPLDDGFQVYRVARQLALGFYYRTDPRPPEPYLAARRAWGDWVRRYVESGTFDSAGQVVLNLGHLPREVGEAYDHWIEERDKFAHVTVVEWLSDHALRWAERWAAEHGPAIIWVQEVAFGEELARRLGTAWHGQDSRITDEDGSRTVVASLKANMKGFNLQCFHRMLYMSPPASADWWEQSLGREHRDGQTKDVHASVYIGCSEHLRAVANGMDRAETIERTTRQPQKLCQADFRGPGGIPNRDHPAWTRSRAQGNDDDDDE